MASSASSTQIVTRAPPHATVDDKVQSYKAETDLDRFPEGGTAAWCTVIGAALVQFCGFGYIASFGVYQDFYTVHYLTNVSASTISWIGGVNMFVVTVFSLFAGILYDRGYFYHLMIIGSLLESFALFMLSLAQPGQYYQIFLAQAIGLGIAPGLMYIPAVIVVSHYFRQRRTLAMSLVTCGTSLGSIIHPIMLNYLFNRGVGFATGVRISAAMITVLLFVACLLMRTRLEAPKHPVNYLSVGKGVAHDVPFCIMSVGLMFFHVGFYYPVFYFQLDSIKHGGSETFSFYSLVLLNGGSLLGRVSAGFIAPYVGVPGLMIIVTAVCGIIITGMIGLKGIPTVVVLGTTFGYFSGIHVAVLLPLVAVLTSDLGELGARMGIAAAIIGFGDLTSGPLAGALLTSRYEWWQSSLFAGLAALVGSSLLAVMQLILMRRRTRSIERQQPS